MRKVKCHTCHREAQVKDVPGREGVYDCRCMKCNTRARMTVEVVPSSLFYLAKEEPVAGKPMPVGRRGQYSVMTPVGSAKAFQP